MRKIKQFEKAIKYISTSINGAVGRLLIITVISSVSMLLSGCRVLPQKEVINMAPVLKEYEPETYSLVKVEKGTVSLEKDIECTYAQMKEEDLSFGLTGITIAKVYCSAGDTVKKGDLLAELDIGSLETELSDADYSIDELNLLISQNKDLIELEIEKQKLVNEQSGLNTADANEAIAAIQNKYDTLIRSYEDSLYLAEIKKESVKEKIDSYRIYADIDGTISYVKQLLEGATSVKNDVIIKIIDSYQSVFVTSAENASYFTEGEDVTVITADNSYDTKVLLPSDKEGSVCFQLKIPDINLEIGDSGSVHIELEKHDNTLYLPVNVIHKAGDSYYVYYVDETGVQNMKTIEIGIESKKYIEITDGLEYGEAVIDK